MQHSQHEPRPTEPDKQGPTADPEGHAQPKAAEVESARLLANDARETLRAKGLKDDDIQRLADEFIALDKGQDVSDFIAWAQEHASHVR
jgi:hypothetical protein